MLSVGIIHLTGGFRCISLMWLCRFPWSGWSARSEGKSRSDWTCRSPRSSWSRRDDWRPGCAWSRGPERGHRTAGRPWTYRIKWRHWTHWIARPEWVCGTSRCHRCSRANWINWTCGSGRTAWIPRIYRIHWSVFGFFLLSQVIINPENLLKVSLLFIKRFAKGKH